MSEDQARPVDIEAWVEKARADPLRYRERQATEIVLHALAAVPQLRGRVFLKGGVLMGVVYDSPRQTADLDYSINVAPVDIREEDFRAALDFELQRTAPRLGYPDLVCRVQTIRHQPARNRFEQAQAPALQLKIGFAMRDAPDARRLERGQAPHVIDVDLSLNEPVSAVQRIRLQSSGEEIEAYGLTDLIAEKLRALLQQEIRNRYRRQDKYDIAYLLDAGDIDAAAATEILAAFRAKCAARGIDPDPASLSAPEVARRARADWASLALEIDDLPDFEVCFGVVERFYRNLPWP